MTVIMPNQSGLFFLFLGLSSTEVRKNEKPFSGMKVLCCFFINFKIPYKKFFI